jgi:integral membrane protein
MKSNVLNRYRVAACVTAVWLLIFTGFIIAKYAFGAGDTLVVSQIHGVLFIVYVIFAFDLGSKARWPFGKLLWVLAAGCIPAAAFFVERGITKEIRPLIAAEEETAPAKA